MIRGENEIWEKHQGFDFKDVNYEMFIKNPNEFIRQSALYQPRTQRIVQLGDTNFGIIGLEIEFIDIIKDDTI